MISPRSDDTINVLCAVAPEEPPADGAGMIDTGPPDTLSADEIGMGSVIKKRRKKIRKHKYKKLRKRMRNRK